MDFGEQPIQLLGTNLPRVHGVVADDRVTRGMNQRKLL